MASFTGDTEESTEDLTGVSVPEKRKFRLKSLRTRLFGKKRREEGREGKLSHSASDITQGEGLGSEEDLVCSQGALGSRALSHDSIFQADPGPSGPEASGVLSQENVHGKIKALQDKLQQQNLHLGPPPLVLPIKRQDDLGGGSEHDGLIHTPPEDNTPPHNTSYKASSQPSSCPLSPVVRPPPTRSMPPTPSIHPAPLSVPTLAPLAPGVPPVDFSSPAQYTRCLDSSAARHRMAIKPRNQRASAKTRRLTTNESRPRSESLNNIERPPSKKNEGIAAVKEMMRLRSHSTHVLGAGAGVSAPSIAPPGSPLKILELTPLQPAPPKAQEALRPSDPSSILPHRPSPQWPTLPEFPDSSPEESPGAKPLKPAEPPSGKQPQPSSTLPGLELRNRGEGALKPASAQSPAPPPAQNDPSLSTPDPESHNKDPVSSARPSTSLSAVAAFKTSSLKRGLQEGVCQGKAAGPPVGQEDPEQVEAGPIGWTQRATSGSGSFKMSVTPARVDQGRPRTGSFLALVEQAGAGLRKEGMAGVVEAKIAMDTGTVEGESREGVEEAMEAKEEEDKKEETAKTAFGVKLRSTSLSVKYRPEAVATVGQSDPKVKRYSAEMGPMTPPLAAFDPTSRPLAPDQRDSNANLSLKKPPSNISNTAESDARTAAQPTPLSLKDVQLTHPAANNAPVAPLEAPATSLPPREAQPPQAAPQAAPQAEVSWMSLAMEKTRSLQQLFTSRLPREFPGMQQAAPRPQTEPQTQKQANSQLETQTVTQSQTQNASQFQTAKQMPAEMARAPVSLTTSQPQIAKQPQSTGVIQPQTQAPLQLNTTTQTTKPTTTQTTSQAHTGKLSQTQDITQIPIQANRPVQPTITQPPAQFPPRFPQVDQQPNLRTTQPLLRSLPQTRGETPSQAPSLSSLSSNPKPTPSQAPWSSRGLHSNPQPKPTTQDQGSTLSPAPAPAQALAPAPAQALAPAPAPAPALAPAPTPGGGSFKMSVNSARVDQGRPRTGSFLALVEQAGAGLRKDGMAGVVEAKISMDTGTVEGAPALAPALAPVLAPVLAPASGPGRDEKASSFQGRGDGAARSERRVARPGIVGERAAAFLEKQTEWTVPAGTKVELRKTPFETVTTESTAPNKTTPTSSSEGRPESSPTKVPGRLADREDKWPRKNTPSSSSPSSSPISSSPLQNISNSGQPSWMELAKRKSMAWGDKTMD